MTDVPDNPADQLLTTTEAATLAGVGVTTICNWANPERGFFVQVGEKDGKPVMERRHLEPAGLNERNKPLYRLLDVARAEHATRRRAGRVFTGQAA